VVSVLPLESIYVGFNRAEDDGIVKGDKNPQHAFLRRRSDTVGAMSQDFTAC
jgi:hypothetical protein